MEKELLNKVVKIEEIDKSKFYLVKAFPDIDLCTANEMRKHFAKIGIQCVVVSMPDNGDFNFTSFEDKKECVKYLKDIISVIENSTEEKSKFNEECQSDCPVHKLITHNACFFCDSLRNSIYHGYEVHDMTDSQIIKMQKELENEM